LAGHARTDYLTAQVKTNNDLWKWTTWAFLQAIPSPTLFEDKDNSNTAVRFGLEWQVTPVLYSFNSNKYVSNFDFFFINPVKRFSGSAEIFFQPEYVPGGFKYSGLNRFMFKSGARLNLPVFHKGEYLSFSLGGGYYYSKTKSGELIEGITYEAGVYSFFGMLGVKFSYNRKSRSSYNTGIYFKYY
jgi:hypothetical protein